MLINIKGFELEIKEDLFVSVENDTMSQFCEWRSLDENTRQSFRELEREISRLLEKFMASDQRVAFDAVSEKYGAEETECRMP